MLIKINKQKMGFVFILTISIFLLSIVNYGFHWIVVTLMFLLLLFKKFPINRKKFLSISFGKLILIFIFFLYLILGLVWYDKASIKLYLISFFYMFLSFFYSKIISEYVRIKGSIVAGTFLESIYIIVSLYFLVVLFQHIWFFSFKYYIDLHYLITLGKYVSRIESASLSSFNIIRPTAFSIEPSNLANIIAYLILLYSYFSGICRKKFRNVSILTPAVSLSFTAIFVFFITYILVSFGNKKRGGYFTFFYKSFILLPFLMIIGYIGYEILNYRINGEVDYDAIGFRLEMLKIILEDVRPVKLLLGHGIYMSEEQSLMLYGTEISHSKIRDSGLILNLIFTFGFPLTIVFYYFFLSIIVRVSIVSALMFVALGFLKFDYMQPMFWFCIFLIASNKYVIEKKVSNEFCKEKANFNCISF